jgi:hypothetical protein
MSLGTIFWWIVTATLSYLLAPKPRPPKPAALEEFDVPTADADRPIPQIFGTVYINSPNVVWYGDLRVDAIEADVDKK